MVSIRIFIEKTCSFLGVCDVVSFIRCEGKLVLSKLSHGLLLFRCLVNEVHKPELRFTLHQGPTLYACEVKVC